MELKLCSLLIAVTFLRRSFNRTAYGIETFIEAEDVVLVKIF